MKPLTSTQTLAVTGGSRVVNETALFSAVGGLLAGALMGYLNHPDNNLYTPSRTICGLVGGFMGFLTGVSAYCLFSLQESTPRPLTTIIFSTCAGGVASLIITWHGYGAAWESI